VNAGTNIQMNKEIGIKLVLARIFVTFQCSEAAACILSTNAFNCFQVKYLNHCLMVSVLQRS
jgi:hypothetical protein